MQPNQLDRRFDAICEHLGYVGSGTFTTSADLSGDRRHSHSVREALTTIGVRAIFSISDASTSAALKAVVYISTAQGEEELLRLRREVWTQGVVPFLIVVMSETVLICSGFEPPSKPPLEINGNYKQNNTLKKLCAAQLRSSLTWRDFNVNVASTVDNELVAAIEALSECVRHRRNFLDERPELVSALIGRFLYLYVLIDRRIVTREWMREQANGDVGVENFIATVTDSQSREQGNVDLWSSDNAFAIFDAVDEAINGSVFPISNADRVYLDDSTCHLIHRVLRVGEKIEKGGRQLSFFYVSYRVVRTETISAIYERFVALQGDQRKKDHGVFYTPPYLVDHVLDRVEEIAPINRYSRVLDPAAGSGIFLVSAFRRLMEHTAPVGGWRPEHIAEARDLLTSCIFGIEKLPEAANVCKFSLYLTLLDYVGQTTMQALRNLAGQTKFLPSLAYNVVARDAFEIPFGTANFTHVIGNPPWAQSGGQKDRMNKRKTKIEENLALKTFKAKLNAQSEPVVHGRLGEYFYWLGRRLLARDGVLAFVMPAHSLIGKHARRFARAAARETTPKFVGNLSHLRRKLFEGSEAPACLVVAKNKRPDSWDFVQTYRPLISSLPLGKRYPIWILPLSQTDLQSFPVTDLQEGTAGWFEQTMLRTLDRRTLHALAVWTHSKSRSFGDFIRRSRLVLQKGGGPNETGIARRQINGRTKPVSPLSDEELLKIPTKYRARFSGDVILLPRAPGKPAIHLATPHQFPTTFNALLPASRDSNANTESGGIVSEALWRSSIPNITAYINSGVVGYFVALYGPTYLMDAMRFEREDLLSIPCPFEDLNDPEFSQLAASDDVDNAILDAMRAGAEFRSAFAEFCSFRKGFGNAQVPGEAFRRPDLFETKRYMEKLELELRASINLRNDLKVLPPVYVASENSFNLILLYDGAPKLRAPLPPMDRFLSTSTVSVSSAADAVILVKSTARHAWTIEQAVSDAMIVRSEIELRRRSRSEAAS